MTAPPSPVLYRSRWFPWILLLVGLIIGYFVGKTSEATARGDCIRRDSSLVSINVSQKDCQASCSTCSWVQD